MTLTDTITKREKAAEAAARAENNANEAAAQLAALRDSEDAVRAEWAAVCAGIARIERSLAGAHRHAEGQRADIEAHRGHLRDHLQSEHRDSQGEAIRISRYLGEMKGGVVALEFEAASLEKELATERKAALAFASKSGVPRELWPAGLE